jgi:hypothetical protein
MAAEASVCSILLKVNSSIVVIEDIRALKTLSGHDISWPIANTSFNVWYF